MNLLKLTSIIIIMCSANFNTAVADEWENQVKLQLLNVEEELEDIGLTRHQKYTIDNLYEDSTQEHPYYFEAGTQYYVVGACDVDCSDIDMWLYDENRDEVDEDVSDDDMPVLIFTPRQSGIFYVKTKMYECSDTPCSHGHVIMSD